jgi:hypothetical protein
MILQTQLFTKNSYKILRLYSIGMFLTRSPYVQPIITISQYTEILICLHQAITNKASSCKRQLCNLSNSFLTLRHPTKILLLQPLIFTREELFTINAFFKIQPSHNRNKGLQNKKLI